MNLAVFLAFFVIGFVFGPVATIWSLNTLFLLEIPYTIQTFLAVIFLQMVTFGGALIRGNR